MIALFNLKAVMLFLFYYFITQLILSFIIQSVFLVSIIKISLLPILFILNLASMGSMTALKQEKLIELTHWQCFMPQKTSSKNIDNFSIAELVNSNAWVNVTHTNKIKKEYNNEVIWLKTKLPEYTETDAAVYLGQVTYSVQVYLADKMVCQIGSTLESNKYIRWNQVLIPLPHYKKDSDLILKIRMGKEFNGLFEKALLGASLNMTEKIFYNDLVIFILLIVFLFTGTITILIYFLLQRTKIFVELFFLLISITALIFVNLSFVQLFVRAPALFFHLNYISLGIGSVCIFMIIEDVVIDKYKLLVNIIWKIRLSLLLLTILLLSLTALTYNDVAKYLTSFTIIGFLVSIVTISLSAVKSKYESKILFIGIIAVAVSAITEIIIFLIRGAVNTEFGYKIIIIPFGILLFILSAIWVAAHTFRETNAEIERNKQKALESVKRENESRQLFAIKLIESQENERSRISLELHDSVGQKLLLIKNRIHSLVNNFAGETSKEALIDVGSLTGETISEIRNITSNLHPPILEQVGLTSAIDVLVEKISKNTKIVFNVFIDNIDKLIPPKDEINFYRIVQESINNIIKHSQASEAFVKITKDGDLIILEIKDDGVGMEKTTSKANNGIGITGMKERAAILGSEININSDNNGTTIKMEYRRNK